MPSRRVQISGCEKNKTSGENETEQVLYKRRGELVKEEEKKGKKKTRTRLEIVPVRVIKLSRPRIGRNHALNTTALRPASITPTRSAHLRYTPRPVLLHVLLYARRERDMRARLFTLTTLRAAG
jgi:hypothetical protein